MQEHANAAIAVARILSREYLHRREHRCILGRQAQLVAGRGADSSPVRARRPVARADLLEYLEVQISLGKELLQPAVLTLQGLQMLDAADQPTSTVTRRNVAAIRQVLGYWLWFWLWNSVTSSVRSSSVRPAWAAASNAFMVGP